MVFLNATLESGEMNIFTLPLKDSAGQAQAGFEGYGRVMAKLLH